MKPILLLDTETTGTDDGAVCIEVAVALYDIQLAAVTRTYSSLIQADSNAAEHINGIAPALLANAPIPQAVWAGVAKFAAHAEAIVAHGAEFDKRFVPSSATNGLPWICSCNDLEWSRPSSSKSLVSIALAHGVGVSSAHRAFADVDVLARLLTRVHEMGADLEALLARGLRPKARFVIAERGFDAARNALAKQHGFWFDYDTKEWVRTMAIEDVSALPFEVERSEL